MYSAYDIPHKLYNISGNWNIQIRTQITTQYNMTAMVWVGN